MYMRKSKKVDPEIEKAAEELEDLGTVLNLVDEVKSMKRPTKAQKKAMDELVRLSQRLGLYDRFVRMGAISEPKKRKS